jgi:hypothetical protein
MDEREAMRRWVETWNLAGPELEAIRRKEHRAWSKCRSGSQS